MDMGKGRNGQFKVTVAGNTVIDGGAAPFMGIMPSRVKIVAAVKDALSP